MNEKIVKLTEMCARSRHDGMSLEEHKIKRDLFDELIEDGLMYNDNGNRKFVQKEHSDYFTETIKNWPNREV